MLNSKIKSDSIARLKKVEGQIRGLQKMLQEEKYCVDILLQISAVMGAVKQVGQNVLKNHIQTCVANVMASSDEAGKAKKINELMEVFDRFMDYK